LPTDFLIDERTQEEKTLVSLWNLNFKDAMIHKAPKTKLWQSYLDAYNGDYFANTALPDYKSNMVSNYVFSIIETIRPIMLDNDPKFQSMPRQPEGMAFSSDLNEALLYEWDREDMNLKTYRELVNVLVLGTTIFYIPWDSDNKNTKAVTISPFNLFPDPLATCPEDAEFLIYASYKNVNYLKRTFPHKANQLQGSQINYAELINGADLTTRIDNQVLVLEIHTKDYGTYEEIDGDKKTVKLKYPHGRVLTICPELGIVLADKANIYNDGYSPFVLIKDYDIPGQFWGEGEPSQLLSPQKHMNDLYNAIIDNAKATANMPWIIDKNAGIGTGKITARPGLIIRKNPGSEVRRDNPPSMPNYVSNTIESFKNDIQHISGIFDSLMGNSATGVYTAQGILALQEAGQSRIRLKVKLLEAGLGKIATLFHSRMRQFWKTDRFIRITRQDGSYDMKMFNKKILDSEYDIKITAGSTMPVNRGAMLDLMIRLAQTPMPDGQPLVDREAVVQYLPEEVKSALLRRMADKQAELNQLQQAVQMLTQQLQQFAQQDQQDDQQTMSVIEDITKAIENLNKQIIQMQQEYDKVVAEKKKQEEMDKIKSDSYNSGYGDAEKLYQMDEQNAANAMQNPMGEGVNEQEGIGQMPDEMLQALENLSDDELALLMQQNPNLTELIN